MDNVKSFFQDKRIFRSRDERMVAGVAGGIAHYLNVDPTIVRLGFAALAIMSFGVAAVAYIVAMVIIPEQDNRDVTLTHA